MHRWLAPIRLAFGLLAAVALGFAAQRAAAGVTGLVDFFSYFTNLSAVAAVVVLLAGGWAGLTGGRPVPGWVRGAVVLCTSVTGLVYGLGVAVYPVALMIPWAGHVLHQVVPLVMFADWLLDPPERRIRPVQAVGWLAFPFLYLAYALLRGWAVDWYPYVFLDPSRPCGYGRVAGACFVTTLGFVLVGAVLMWAGNTLGERRAAGSGSPPRGRRAHARTT